MDKIKICYIDDDCDTYLSAYLIDLKEYDYEEISITSGDTFDSVISTISKKHCKIAILDSKLYKDSSVVHKMTGQELELLLAEKLPYIFTIIISQNDDIAKLNYFEKYKSSPLIDNIIESKKHYDKILSPILFFAKNKINRARICYEQELSKEDHVDKMTLENIESLLNGLERVSLSKEDIDEIVNILGELKDYEDKH